MAIPARGKCSTLAETLLGIETEVRRPRYKVHPGSTLAETLLGIETGLTLLYPLSSSVPLWLKPF